MSQRAVKAIVALIVVVVLLAVATWLVPFPGDMYQLAVHVEARRYLDMGLNEQFSIDSVTGSTHHSNLLQWGYISPLLFGPPVRFVEVIVTCDGAQAKHAWPLFTNPAAATIGSETKTVDVEFSYLSGGQPHTIHVTLKADGQVRAEKEVQLDA